MKLRRLGILPLCVAAWALAGCAGTAPTPRPIAEGAPRVAVLSFEDLSGQAGVGERLTRIVYTEMARSGRWQVAELGETDIALVEARVRSTSVMTTDQTQTVSSKVGARWLLTGSALEYGRVRTIDGEVPTVGLALRLIDGTTGRVVWADQRFRSGEDRELIFAWGRINDIAQLAARTAAELVKDIRLPAAGDTTSVRRRAP